ncbi:uncharacterized protein LOC129939714 isoform X1 [Eupeodes corollae]|uniref:uncharacterized protein LOC129939714 isoform X1 n=1 Tax=Eupeodes corollae TaxID=290404 RepID=UPI00248FE8E8|nr:uncharacterized protein LOC129939714 isoform X1 [Eupeodes corollae]
MESVQSNSSSNKFIQNIDNLRYNPALGERNRSLESVFLDPDQRNVYQEVTLRRAIAAKFSSITKDSIPNTPLSSPLSNSENDLRFHMRRKSRSETHLNYQPEDSGGTTSVPDVKHSKGDEKTENILTKALKIALEKQEAHRKTEFDQNSESSAEDFREGSPGNSMMMSTPPSGVQTDSDGLILPKKIPNPCLESSDRKNLHRELMFNNKIGKSVLNQKSELQRVLEKKRERQILLQQQQEEAEKTETGLKSELNRVIMERAQKLEKQKVSSKSDIEDHVNPEYISARAKLRNRIEMK